MRIPTISGITAATVAGRHYRTTTSNQAYAPCSDAPESFAQCEYEAEMGMRDKGPISFSRILLVTCIVLVLAVVCYQYILADIISPPQSDIALDQWVGWHTIIKSSGG